MKAYNKAVRYENPWKSLVFSDFSVLQLYRIFLYNSPYLTPWGHLYWWLFKVAHKFITSLIVFQLWWESRKNYGHFDWFLTIASCWVREPNHERWIILWFWFELLHANYYLLVVPDPPILSREYKNNIWYNLKNYNSVAHW